MSAWVPGSGGGQSYSGGGGGTTRKFYDTGGSGGGGTASVYHPTPSGGGGPAGGSGPTNIGVVSINPLDPAGSAAAASDPITGLLDGLKNNLFGTSLPDTAGKHGGLLGDVPVVGDATRFVSEGVAAVGGEVASKVGGAAKVVGGALERVPTSPAASAQVTAQYNDPGLQTWLNQKDETGVTNRSKFVSDTGVLGTGVFSNEEHMKATAIRAYEDAQQVKNPTLLGGKFTPAPTVADTVNTLFDLMGAAISGVERTSAGLDKANGMDQLDMIKAVGNGTHAWDTFGAQNTPVEQLAYEKTKNGEWTDSQALDWIASHGAGFSHDTRLEIASTVVLDPLNAATFGAGAAAKAGLKGAEVLAAAGRTEQMLSETRNALKLAEETAAVAKGARATKLAATEVERLTGEVAKMEEAAKAAKTYSSTGEGIRKVNVLARKAEGSQAVQDLLKTAGKAYGGLEGTYIGRAAKITRTLIDPMHAMDLHMPGNARTVDLLSDSLTKTLSTTLGDNHYLGALNDLRGLDKTGQLADQYARDLGVAMTNRGREGIAVMHQAGNVDALGRVTAEAASGLRDQVIEEAAKSMKEKDLLKWLRYDVTSNILQHNWSEVAHQNLADQLAAIYHNRDAAEWMKVLPGMSKEHKSLLKLATYGNSNSRLLSAISNSAGHASAAAFDLNRIVLLAKTTLTRVGGDSLLAQLSAKGMNERDALTIIRDWQQRYPELRYIAIDEANTGKSIKQFTKYVKDHLDSMPMQVKADELASMHPDMQELGATLGDGYQLGFRPRDEFLWGIERSNVKGGGYAIKRAPWIDHVGEGGLGYRPGRTLPLNIMGMPIVGGPVSKVVKAVDYMEAGSRVLRAQVSGAQIAEVARQRFVSEAARARFAEHGLTEQVAQKWWDRIQEFTREHQGYSGARGFSKEELYGAISKENLIPQTMLNGSMRLQESDILRMVMEAYDGDVRYIGLTQKLSGKVKKVASAATGFNTNFAGQISEHAWPTLKFRYNPIFQLQEKIEPWVLNAQRGVSFATGTTLSEADRATERLLQKLTDNSLIRQANLDQAEFSSQVLLGKKLGEFTRTPGTRLEKITSMAQSITDVQGVKRINMLRTFRQGLGKEMRAAWDEARPGEWDQMFLDAQGRAGKTLSEDNFALQMMGENLFANDIVVSRVMKAGKAAGLKADWGNAVKPGAWYVPSHFGEMPALDLDHVAASMQTLGSDGKKIENLGDLRRYVAEDNGRVEQVSDFLRRMNADPDYIARVENSLTFSWEGFWQEAGKRFSLTSEESKSLQDMVAGSAEVRGMAPADFLSQVYAPGIANGTEGIIGSLDRPLGVLRRNKAGEVTGSRGRSVLEGTQGVSTREDLVRQLSATFSAHLDPSAKRALLMEFRPELRQAVKDGTIKLDIRDLDKMWNDGAEGQLADRILGYMDGKPGVGAADIITDPNRGLASLRAGADKYLERNGVTPLAERRHYQIDEAHYQQVADEYGALPETPYNKTGRRPMTKQVYAADTDLKPQPAGVDDRTYQTYQQFVHETRAQWDHMTTPKGKGGMGIKVTVAKGDPYTADAAGRAAMNKDLAKGELRVKGTDSDHPLMTNEQNVMFRAVHDVFGHAAEGHQFGPRGEMNAAAAHFRLYSADARGALLTETHGQTAYVNYSNDVLPTEGPKPLGTNPIADYTARYPQAAPTEQVLAGKGGGFNDQWGEANTDFTLPIVGPVGKDFSTLPANAQQGILQQLGDLQDQFPDYRLQHVDALAGFEEPVELGGIGMDSTTHAVTFDSGAEPVIILNPRYFDEANGAGWDPTQKKWLQGMGMSTFNGTPRQTVAGTPWNVMDGPEHVLNHEFGHAVLGRITDSYMSQMPENKLVNDVVNRFLASGDVSLLSEYGARDPHEAMADLFSVMMSHPDALQYGGVDMKIAKWSEELRTALIDSGHMKPYARGTAGKTVREANAAKRGSVYAPQKAGLLPQSTIDHFAEQFVGQGKHVESNPDVARTAQMFGKWSGAAVTNGLLKGDQAIHAGLLNDIAGIPTHSAVPYNLTEGLAHQLANATMARKWEDAYRLQYFAQDRSMLERSINHPMFGLYPASYMWGKLMPEVVGFLAQRPFGIRTGGLGYSLMDTQANIAMQSEFNPDFGAHMEKLGSSQALSFGGYLLPTLPWDVSASAPTWMKDVASQGQRNEANVAAGQPVEDLNAMQPAVDVIGKLNPLATTLPWAGRALDELNGPNTPTEKRQLLVEQSGATKATGLSPELSAIMAELQAELSR